MRWRRRGRWSGSWVGRRRLCASGGKTLHFVSWLRSDLGDKSVSIVSGHLVDLENYIKLRYRGSRNQGHQPSNDT